MVFVVQVQELANIPFPFIRKNIFPYWFLSGQIPDNRIFNPENRISFGCSRDNIRITGFSIRKIGFAKPPLYLITDLRVLQSGKLNLEGNSLPHNRSTG